MSDRTINPRLMDFMIMFSRMEYALKRSQGFSEPGRNINLPIGSDYKLKVAQANWSEFAKIIGPSFFEKCRVCPLTEILWEMPAGCWAIKKEDNKSELLWHHEDIEEYELNGFRPVLRVRNCVFHGDSQDYIKRHVDLVEASICVLELALVCCLQDQRLQPIYDRFKDSKIY